MFKWFVTTCVGGVCRVVIVEGRLPAIVFVVYVTLVVGIVVCSCDNAGGWIVFLSCVDID